ncbi:MAG: glycosyltransferase family 4 protein [Acidobacteriota bacterium]|nr:glycosyltransferase family 4 protein [Acidobacteriota bacterium]
MATVIGNICSHERLNERFSINLWPSFRSGNIVARFVFSESKLLSFRLQRPTFDVYHVHVAAGRSLWRKLAYIESLKERSKRAILHVHSSTFDTFFDSCSHLQQARIRKCLSAVGRVVVLSEEWERFFLDRKICEERLIKVLHNAVSIPCVPTANYQSSEVLFLGRLGERKSPSTLIQAAAVVIRSHPNAMFHFAGDGDATPYIKLSDSLGISAHCIFHGWTQADEKDRLLTRCSIHCLPSRHEGMPMSVLETMAAGLVNVCTPVGGVPQVIDEGRNGYLVDVDDYQDLARAINALFDNRELLSAIGLYGRETIIDRFGIDAYTGALSSLYTLLLGEESIAGMYGGLR